MSRSGFAISCALNAALTASVIVATTAASAESPCAGIWITDVVETETGARATLGEWCSRR